jgi:hypothetical protein
MSDQPKDGGAVHPRQVVDHPAHGFVYADQLMSVGGMSLRDYFAGQALAGMLANPWYDGHTARGVAKAAYEQADAMLAERERRAGE